jgi:hypothetical protein
MLNMPSTSLGNSGGQLLSTPDLELLEVVLVRQPQQANQVRALAQLTIIEVEEQVLPGLQLGVHQLDATAGALPHVRGQHGPEDPRPDPGDQGTL